MPVMKKGEQNGTGPAILPPAEQKRMILSAIRKSERSDSEKIVLYGWEGWGKTTWASKAPAPVFLSSEDGLKSVTVDVFPELERWEDILEAVDVLRKDDHEFKTLVLDSADWSENLCQNYILNINGKKSIEDFGFGKGWVICFEEWKRLLSQIDKLRAEKKMNVIFIAHATVKPYKNPMGEDYDRVEMKTDRRVATVLKEWADNLLFGTYDIAVDVKAGQSRGKGYGSERIVYTSHSAAYDAKNRSSLPGQLTADASEFWAAVKGGQS